MKKFLLILACAGFACKSADNKYKDAILARDWDGMEKALKDGADVNAAVRQEPYSAFRFAIQSGDLNRLEMLLQYDTGDRQKNRDEELLYALELEQRDIILRLLKSKVDMSRAVKYVAWKNKSNMLTLLLENGAKVSTDDDNCDELKEAIGAGHEDMAIRLVELGAKPDTYFRRFTEGGVQTGGHTNLCIAAKKNMSRLVEKLLAKKPRLDVTCDYKTPLTWAKVNKNEALYAKIKNAGGKEGDTSQSGSSASVASRPVEATDNNCKIEHVMNSARGGRCTQIRKANGLYLAWDHDCASKKSSSEVQAKILAGCALGGKRKHFEQVGLRIPAENEYK